MAVVSIDKVLFKSYTFSMVQLYCKDCNNNLLLFEREETANSEKFLLRCGRCLGILYEHEDVGEKEIVAPPERVVN